MSIAITTPVPEKLSLVSRFRPTMISPAVATGPSLRNILEDLGCPLPSEVEVRFFVEADPTAH